MAEILVSAVTEILIEKLVSIVSGEISLVWGVKGELKRLQTTLRSINAVLTDAERQQVEEETVKLWLENLKDVVYEAEDILEEFEYEALKQQVEVLRKRDKVKNFFSASNNPLGFSHKIAHKIKVLNQRLDRISKDKERFSFHVSQSPNNKATSRNRETHSLVDVSMFVGREREKLEIIDLLLDRSSINQQISRIILIVAMGGVGKTTLAQIVYGSDVVTQHFENRIWVCVSDNSNQKQVFHQLLESINEKKEEYSSLDVMVNILKKEFENTRYLIVLDDMWQDDHNEWDDMLNVLLLLGAQGSKVIITSRSNEITSLTSSLFRYELACLSKDDSWSMLEKIAFGPEGVGKTTELIEIGKKIAQKCGGVPLTTKVLGHLMYSKKSEHDWQLIENNEIWNLPAGEKKVIGVLKLSYDHLEPALKQCFRYCSLYPKDSIIQRENLVWKWMAEGFLGQSKQVMDMETVGNQYFDSLLNNSFFVKEFEFFGITKSYCKMHDLVHDLAQSVAKGESLMVKNVNEIGEEGISRLRRVSLVFENDEFSPLPTSLAEAKKLRSFTAPKFIDNSYAMQIFTNFSYVRVLELRNSSVSELPPSIAKLIHLRYLDLSHSASITKLPDSITTLYNLQTLILEYCPLLKDLPEDMIKLTMLSHLVFEGSPKDTRYLTSLTYLPRFDVGKEKGLGIEELRYLNLLSGKLAIAGLENIKNGKDAELGGMKKKERILELKLYWNGSDEKNVCEEVFQGLQPHPNLKKLVICGYFGSKFPPWMMSPKPSLPNLVQLGLYYFEKCERLPPLGSLPLLKSLEIHGLVAVKSIGSEFYGGGGSNNTNVSYFPSLEDLYIWGMDELVEWSDPASSSSSTSSFSSFPRLKELSIKDCPKLTLMPTRFPSLERLHFENSNGTPIVSLVETNCSSLTNIDIYGCEGLVSLPMRVLRGNNILGRLEIHNCENFQGFTPSSIDVEDGHNIVPSSSLNELVLRNCGPLNICLDLRGFNSLQNLEITFSNRQECISGIEYIIKRKTGIEFLPKLETLDIGIGEEDEEQVVESFPFPDVNIEEEDTTVTAGIYFPSLYELTLRGGNGRSELKCLPVLIQYITSLQSLRIHDFNSLVALPEWLGNLVSLRELDIIECRNLKYLPSQEQMLRLTSLRKLSLKWGSNVLSKRCKEGGEEAYKIPPEVEVE